jgi:hypothetical protein
VARNAAKPLGEDLGVAELAAGAHLRATTYRVPRSVGPLDRGSITHVTAKIMRNAANVKLFSGCPGSVGGHVCLAWRELAESVHSTHPFGTAG